MPEEPEEKLRVKNLLDDVTDAVDEIMGVGDDIRGIVSGKRAPLRRLIKKRVEDRVGRLRVRKAKGP